eukprot:217374_1
MVLSLIILCNVLITTILSDNIFHCNDECLLVKFKKNLVIKKTHIILPSYNISNNIFINNALIWINPCNYFSNIFLQKLTNKNQPTNDDFRNVFYLEYIKANNLSLILQINKDISKDINIEYLNNIISKYRFDGYIHIINTPIHTNKISQLNNRQLLAYGNDESITKFDVLNQHTWDEYDWFLYVFSICSFGSCCLCCGWCSHKKYISDKIVEDEDINDLEIPISPKTPSDNNNQKKMSFAGFNILGDKVQQSPHIPHNNYNNYNEYNNQIYTQSHSHQTPTLQSVSMHAQMHQFQQRNSQLSDIDLSQHIHNIDPRLIHQLQQQHTPTLQSHTNATNVSTPVIYETDNTMMQIVAPTLMQQQIQPQPPQPPQVPMNIELPSQRTSIIPKYKLNKGASYASPQTAGIIASPDSAEPSESHLSIDMFVKRVNSSDIELQSIGYTPTEQSINKEINEDNDIDNPYDIQYNNNNNESHIPLQKMQSITLNGLGIINE